MSRVFFGRISKTVAYADLAALDLKTNARLFVNRMNN